MRSVQDVYRNLDEGFKQFGAALLAVKKKPNNTLSEDRLQAKIHLVKEALEAKREDSPHILCMYLNTLMNQIKRCKEQPSAGGSWANEVLHLFALHVEPSLRKLVKTSDRIVTEKILPHYFISPPGAEGSSDFSGPNIITVGCNLITMQLGANDYPNALASYFFEYHRKKASEENEKAIKKIQKKLSKKTNDKKALISTIYTDYRMSNYNVSPSDFALNVIETNEMCILLKEIFSLEKRLEKIKQGLRPLMEEFKKHWNLSEEEAQKEFKNFKKMSDSDISYFYASASSEGGGSRSKKSWFATKVNEFAQQIVTQDPGKNNFTIHQDKLKFTQTPHALLLSVCLFWLHVNLKGCEGVQRTMGGCFKLNELIDQHQQAVLPTPRSKAPSPRSSFSPQGECASAEDLPTLVIAKGAKRITVPPEKELTISAFSTALKKKTPRSLAPSSVRHNSTGATHLLLSSMTSSPRGTPPLTPRHTFDFSQSLEEYRTLLSLIYVHALNLREVVSFFANFLDVLNDDIFPDIQEGKNPQEILSCVYVQKIYRELQDYFKKLLAKNNSARQFVQEESRSFKQQVFESGFGQPLEMLTSSSSGDSLAISGSQEFSFE